MKPLRLRATNFRTFPELDLELHGGLVGILGELRDAPDGADSNGAGKSSILEAIDIALFGRRSLAGFLTRGGDVTELMLELTFEHAGDTYRVRRSFSARTKATKTSVDFERRTAYEYDTIGADGWVPLTRSSSKETDALIVETIGLTRDTFRNSSYLRQGDGSYADPARDPKQRKDLLVEAALGRDPVWPRLVDAAKAERRHTQVELDQIRGETMSAHELVDTKADVEEQHRNADDDEHLAVGRLAVAEKELETLLAQHAAATEGAARRQTVEAELTMVNQTLVSVVARNARANEAAKIIVEAIAALEKIPAAADTAVLEERAAELTRQIDAHRDAVAAHDLAVRENQRADQRCNELLVLANESEGFADAVGAKIEKLKTEPDTSCELCGQALHEAARAKTIGEYEEEIGRHIAKARADRDAARRVERYVVHPIPTATVSSVELEAVRAEIRLASTHAQQRATLEERIRQCEPDASAGPSPDEVASAHHAVVDKQTELDDIEPVDLTVIEHAGQNARAAVTVQRNLLDTAKVTRARLDERLAAITKAEKKIAVAIVREQELQVLVDEYTLVERACGRDGIPALLIENRAIPYIESVATEILHDLGTSFRVELRTQAALKSGEGLRDTLEVVVIDPDGNEADFAEGTSGGEQTRIGLALRIALARLLANRRGAESRLLALDEPSYLDAAGMTALLRVLRGLQDEFSQILLVSHVPELRDSLDEAIVVVKDGGRSRISTGSTITEWVEEVAA